MIIVITPEESFKNETENINALFYAGLDFLHVRKPCITQDEMTDFIQRIDQKYHDQLILHNHYEVAENFDLSRFHFREADRKNGLYTSFTDKIITTSVHDIAAFNDLEKDWEYAFFSPAFPSISKKGYGENSAVLNEIKKRDNPHLKLIALGGIHENNISEAFENGADGVALLGAIWKSGNPLNVFKKCRQNVLLY